MGDRPHRQRNQECFSWRKPERSGRGGQEFVAIDASRNAPVLLPLLDPHDLCEAADMDIAGHGDLARQGENEFDGFALLKIGVNQKVKSAETDVPRLSFSFKPAFQPIHTDRQRKRHRKAP